MSSTVRNPQTALVKTGAPPVAADPRALGAEPPPDTLVAILYAATVFSSAFLLFQVQPLIAKAILPWFGGSAAVWSASLVFFQTMLLGGYAYAHFSIGLVAPNIGAIIHVGLLVSSCALLPIVPSPAFKPAATGDPTIQILMLLGATVGLPYFLLSSTSPMLQAWYGRRARRGNPYRLFALSNAGSLLALLSFPVLIEPHLSVRAQAYTWSGAYAVFVICCGAAAWVSRPSRRIEAISAGRPGVRAAVSVRDGLFWAGLAAAPSALLLAVTEHLTQNVAPIPLLWVIPLSLYLLTFVLAFESDKIWGRAVVLPALPAALGAMTYLAYDNGGTISLRLEMPVFLAGLFVCCMACHGELARRRPAAEHLTAFYFMVALGGAAGGAFVALAAPHLFRSYAELPIALLACALVITAALWNVRFRAVRPAVSRLLLAATVVVFAVSLLREETASAAGVHLRVRNFYGALRVVDVGGERVLFHGTIWHGAQLLEDRQGRRATSYYGANSGVGRALRALESAGPVKVGIVGLGAGVVMSYSRPGDVYRIYELNPLVESIARRDFTFYSASPADARIFLGDARLTLERQPDQHFDLLAVDAFSGDAVPVHLLTREAFALYLRHLKPNGMLALNVTNRYLDLSPVIAASAAQFGRHAVVVYDRGQEAAYLIPSRWVLVTADDRWFASPSFQTADPVAARAPRGFRGWSDDYSNLFEVLRRGKPPAFQVKSWTAAPGAAFGPLRLGAPVRDAIALLGPATETEPLNNGGVAYRWYEAPKNAGVGIRTNRAGVIEGIWALGDRRYVTSDGIHVRSPVSAVESALGRPSRVTTIRAPATRILWYDSRGLWFGIDDDPASAAFRTVHVIGVIPPQ